VKAALWAAEGGGTPALQGPFDKSSFDEPEGRKQTLLGKSSSASHFSRFRPSECFPWPVPFLGGTGSCRLSTDIARYFLAVRAVPVFPTIVTVTRIFLYMYLSFLEPGTV